MSESGGFERTDRELLVGIKRDLRYLREKLEEHAREFEGYKRDVREHERDIETRLRDLEKFRWWFIGAVFGSAGLAAGLTRLLLK